MMDLPPLTCHCVPGPGLPVSRAPGGTLKPEHLAAFCKCLLCFCFCSLAAGAAAAAAAAASFPDEQEDEVKRERSSHLN